MTDASPDVHAVLVPGYWLGGWAWQAIEPTLLAAGITPHPVTLPGLDGTDSAGIELDDHIQAIVDLIAGLRGRIVLVGHSGGGPVAQGALDRCPQRIARVVYVDSGPLLDGAVLRPGAIEDVPLPSWEQLAAEQASVDGMDDAALATFRDRAVPQPVGVATAPVRLTDDRRLAVPASVVCTSIPSDTLQQLIAAGQLPSELPAVHDVRYIDLPTGHWPMFSRPDDLAAILRDEITTC